MLVSPQSAIKIEVVSYIIYLQCVHQVILLLESTFFGIYKLANTSAARWIVSRGWQRERRVCELFGLKQVAVSPLGPERVHHVPGGRRAELGAEQWKF